MGLYANLPFLVLLVCACSLLSSAPLAFVGPAPLPQVAEEAALEAEATEARTSVVLVIFDQLPVSSLMRTTDEIEGELFPNFAKLAAESTWFRNASACYKRTVLALPSILTGNLVEDHSLLPRFQDHPQNLFTLLAGSHRMVVHERITAMCPTELLEGGRPQYGLDSKGAPRADHFRRFVARFDGGPGPTLGFLHVMLPHVPWEFVPSGKKYGTKMLREVGLGAWSKYDALLDLGVQRHLLQLGFVDALLGELIGRMKEVGAYDETLVIITSDHGCSLRGLDRDTPTIERARDLLHVPLFVKLPGQTDGRIVDRNVESIDLLPTIADVLGIEVPWETDGRSAFDEEPARKKKVLHNKGGGSVAVDGTFPEAWPALDHKRTLFGESPTWRDVFQPGQASEELGRPVEEFELGVLEGAQARIANAEAIRAWEGTSTVYPGLLLGSVTVAEGDPAPREVVFAINGVIRGVSQTYAREGSSASFVALISDKDLPAHPQLRLYTRGPEGRLLALESN